MITIVNYGMGNLRSVEKAFQRLDVPIIISSDPDEVKNAGKLILPGVGHFGHSMENLRSTGMYEAVQEVKKKGTPILGIWLGMQLLTLHSEEGDCPGLEFIPSNVVRFVDNSRLKIPHMGWNTLEISTHHPILHGIQSEDSFYFAHSYHADRETADEWVVARAVYGYSFPCVLAKENVIGVQFHPEKSHDAGLRILANFVETA